MHAAHAQAHIGSVWFCTVFNTNFHSIYRQSFEVAYLSNFPDLPSLGEGSSADAELRLYSDDESKV